MSAAAVETPVELQPGLSLLERPAEPATNGDVEPWELHSELVLVCTEVHKRALELLPERDPDAFLARPRELILLPPGPADEGQVAPNLPGAVGGYMLWRFVETARSALFAVGGVVALAALAEVLH